MFPNYVFKPSVNTLFQLLFFLLFHIKPRLLLLIFLQFSFSGGFELLLSPDSARVFVTYMQEEKILIQNCNREHSNEGFEDDQVFEDYMSSIDTSAHLMYTTKSENSFDKK